MGPNKPGLGAGRARRVLSVMIKFKNACQCQWVKKNSFFEKRSSGFESRDPSSPNIKSKGSSGYFKPIRIGLKYLNQKSAQVIMFYNLKGEMLCQNI